MACPCSNGTPGTLHPLLLIGNLISVDMAEFNRRNWCIKAGRRLGDEAWAFHTIADGCIAERGPASRFCAPV